MNEKKLALQSETRKAVIRHDATERPRLVLLASSADHALLMGALGPIGLLFARTYFISVTDRSVYVHRGQGANPSPQDLLHVIPLAEAGGLVTRVKLGRMWNKLSLGFPGKKRPTKLKISYHSRAELDSFLEKLPAPAGR